MKVKLSLNIEETLVRKIKVYAKMKNISVSKLIEGLIENELCKNYQITNFSNTFSGILEGKLSTDSIREIKDSKSAKYFH